MHACVMGTTVLRSISDIKVSSFLYSSCSGEKSGFQLWPVCRRRRRRRRRPHTYCDVTLAHSFVLPISMESVDVEELLKSDNTFISLDTITPSAKPNGFPYTPYIGGHCGSSLFIHTYLWYNAFDVYFLQRGSLRGAILCGISRICFLHRILSPNISSLNIYF